MILDHQSFLSGIADVRDRHRDMRLDVDNMSYEVKSHFYIWMEILIYLYNHSVSLSLIFQVSASF